MVLETPLSEQNTNKITAEVQELIDNNETYTEMAESINPYGDGTAAKKIIEIFR